MDTIEKKTALKKRIVAFFASIAVLAGGVVTGAQAFTSPTGTAKIEVFNENENGGYLAGAHLQILNASGGVEADFESDGTMQEFTLPVGKYTLHQVSAPEGYIGVSEDAEFEVKPSRTEETQVLQPAAALPTSVNVHNEGLAFDGIYVMPNGGGNNATAIFCVDASYENAPTGNYNAQQLGNVNGLSRDQLLRILYVGWAGNAKNLGQQFKAANDYDATQQFWIATQYAITSYTNPNVAWDDYGKYLGVNQSLAEQIKAAANDTSIVVPDGSIAYLYTSSGNQPFVAASFPVVSQNVHEELGTQVRIVNVRTTTPPPPPSTGDGEVVINKTDDAGNVLQGAKFQIRNASGAVVKEFTSTGRDEFTLPVGKYTLVETEAPAGYTKSDEVYEFTIEPGTASSVPAGGTASVLGQGLQSGTLKYVGSIETADGALVFCVTPQATWPQDNPGTTTNYAALSESSVDLAAFGQKNPSASQGAYIHPNISNANLTPEKMEQIKKVLWATYDFMYSGDFSDDVTGIIKDNIGQYNAQMVTGGVYQAAQAAIADLIYEGSVNWSAAGDNHSWGNVRTLALALKAAAKGQTAYFAAYSGYSITYLQTEDPNRQNLIVPGSSAVEVTVVNSTTPPPPPPPSSDEGRVIIKKVDENGDFVAGAKLQIKDANGTVVKEFESTGEAQEFALAPGKYTLIETEAPEGYTKSDEVYEFTIEADADGSATPGKTVTVDGNSVGDSLAFGLNQQANSQSGTYTALSESQVDLSAFGLTLEKAEQIKMVLWATYDFIKTGDYEQDYTGVIANNIGTVDEPFYNILASPLDSAAVKKATQAAIAEIVNPGSVNWRNVGGKSETLAKQLLEALKFGKTGYFADYKGYNLVYLQPSDSAAQNLIVPGSSLAEVTVVNTKTPDGEIEISKAAEDGYRHLAGAHLQIQTMDGQVAQYLNDKGEWVDADFVSTGDVMKFRLHVGEYKLVELEAPAGYLLAKPVSFTVVDDSEKGVKREPADLPGTQTHNVQADGLNHFVDDQGRSITGYCVDSYRYDGSAKEGAYSSYDFNVENTGNFIGGFKHTFANRSDAAKQEVYTGLLRILYAGAEGNAYETTLNDVDKWRATQYAVSWYAGGRQDNAHTIANTDTWGYYKWAVWKNLPGKDAAELERYKDALVAAYNDASLDAKIAAAGYKGVYYSAGFQPALAITFGSEGKEKVENKGVVMVDELAPVLQTSASLSSIEPLNDGSGKVKVTIEDIVYYKNIWTDHKYVLKGQLVLKSTKEVLDVSYKTLTTPEINGGLANVTFEFVADEALQEKLRNGDAVVAFEDMYQPHEDLYKEDGSVYSGEEIEASAELQALVEQSQHDATHQDINDTAQTVTLPQQPEIGTTATDQTDDDKLIKPVADAKVKDVVSYTNLTPGKTYTLTGKLVKKSDQSVVAEAEKTFTPETANGTVELVFEFDATKLLGKKLVAFETVSYEGEEVATHADINDEDQTVEVKDTPEIGTTAVDSETGDHIAYADEDVTIVDTVKYTNLVPGKEYTLKGQLVKKSDESVVAEAETTFTPETKDGTVELSFTFDGSALAGDSVVAFETVYLGETRVAFHIDINDEGQTVEFPEAKTTATEGGDHYAVPTGKVTIVDEVKYTNLIPGKEYTVTGTLHDKTTGEALTVEGATATKTFTADKANGSVKLKFTIDASALKGKAVVAFETVTYEGKTVAVHADIKDEEQTVYFPEIGTTATADGYKQVKADGTVTIKDVVAYEGLKPGTEYSLSGKLVTKSSGGKDIVATNSTTFTASETGEGTVELEFTVDASTLAGDSVVAFETVSYDGKEVAVHADIDDADQTVTFPEVKTNASDKADGDQVLAPEKTVTVVDKVTYKNLLVGKTYTVSGVLMDKATGEPLEVNGKQVTAEKTFKATKANGSINLEFTFDASALKGKTLVVFESLKHQDREVAVHADINDVDQTVVISKKPVIGTTLTDGEGGKEVESDKAIELVDTVAYSNLEPGETYTLKGTLVKKSDESVIATGEATFEASESGNGEATMTFTFDASTLGGEQVVAYEYLFIGDLTGKDVTEESDEYVTKHEDLDDAGQTVYVREKPAIEKYVNKNVHKEIDLSEVFTYDVLAYITKDADKAVITDTLNDDLQFVSAAGDVTVVDLGETNNHKPYGTVAEAGTAVETAAVAIDGQTLTVTIDPATAERGHWVKVTFDAKIADGKTIADLTYATVEKNDPVLTDEQHEGVPNDASYKIYVGNEGKYSDESNTVTVKPAKIGTNATGKDTKAHAVFADSKVTVVDVVAYDGLKAGETYTLKGTLVKKSDGSAVATGESTFVASESGKGLARMEFTFDASELAGDSVVAFEYLYRGDVTGKDVNEESEEYVTKHEDLDDEDQTVEVTKPEVKTTASDAADGDKTVAIAEDVVINDVVEFSGLIPGKEYTLVGTLHVKNDAQTPVEAKSVKAVAAEGATVKDADARTFVADKAEGTVTLAFTVDTTSVAGEQVVVFETLKFQGKEIAVHADINDEGQTVTVEEEKPAIEKYVNKNVHKDVNLDEVFTYDVLAYVTKDADKVVITDTLVDDLQFVSAAKDVTVVDLGTENDHTPNGTVAKDGTPVKAEAAIDGQTLTVIIDPATAERGHWVKVTFDAKIKDGLTILDLDYTTITENAPVLTDEEHEGVPNKASYEIFVDNKSKYGLESNTVTVKPTPQTKPKEKTPEIGTTATDNADGDKELAVDSDVTVKDVVEYKNLMPNQVYTLKGKLVVKGTNGEEVVATGETTFTATKNGTVDMFFNLNTTGLEGKELVVYEYLYKGDVIGQDEIPEIAFVAEHADDNDLGQTVQVSKKPRETTPPAETPTPEKSTVPTVTVRPTVKLPITGLPKTGSSVAVGAMAALMLIGGGLVLVRRRQD